MTYLIVLNELTIARLIYLIAMRQNIYLMGINSQIVGVRHVINLLARYFLAKGWLIPVEELGMCLDQESNLRKVAQPGYWQNKAEPVMLDQLHLARQKDENKTYDYAAQKESVKHGCY
jgi:hypothetical protein